MSRGTRKHKEKQWRKRTARAQARARAGFPQRNRCAALIPLRTAAIRKQWTRRCKLALSTFQNAEREWEHFTAEEQPAYHRWLRTALGPILGELQTLARDLEYKQALLEATQLECLLTGDPVQLCYDRVAKGDNFFKRMAEAYEKAWSSFADNPDQAYLDEDEEGDGEEGPRGEHLEEEGEEDPLGSDGEAGAGFFASFGMGPDGFFIELDAPRSEQASDLKQIYRQICRALHPDVAGEMDAQARRLWDWAQQAYKEGDLDRLQIVLAVAQMQGGELAPSSTIAAIIGVTEHFRAARAAVRNEIRGFRRRSEWGFLSWNEQQKSFHLRQARAMMEGERDSLRFALASVESELAPMQRRPPGGPSRSGPARRARHGPLADPDQIELPF